MELLYFVVGGTVGYLLGWMKNYHVVKGLAADRKAQAEERKEWRTERAELINRCQAKTLDGYQVMQAAGNVNGDNGAQREKTVRENSADDQEYFRNVAQSLGRDPGDFEFIDETHNGSQ